MFAKKITLSYIFFFCFLFSVLHYSCESEPITLPIDEQLRRSLVAACDSCANEFAYYQLSKSSIPSPYSFTDSEKPDNDPRVKLGKLLFHETALALNPSNNIALGTYSCATCHFAETGFQAGRFQGIGDGGFGFGSNGEDRAVISSYTSAMADIQPIRSPSLLNAAYQDITNWDGSMGGVGKNIGLNVDLTGTRAEFNDFGLYGLETYAISGIEAHHMAIDYYIIDSLSYKNRFEKAFGDDIPKSDFVGPGYGGIAIAAYLRTIIADEAPFQKWLNGKSDAMTESQKIGANLFFGKAECASCHNGPALNGWTWDDPTSKFYAIGLNDIHNLPNAFITATDFDVRDGRGGFTGRGVDFYKFKVPQLYNLKDNRFYGHGSSFSSVKALIDYKNRGQIQNNNINIDNISPRFKPLNLTDEEIDQLTDFIENALYHPTLVEDYQPDEVNSLNCIPNNDMASRLSLECE